MCGRYQLALPGRTLANLLDAELAAAGVQPTWNAAPTQVLPILGLSKTAGRTAGDADDFLSRRGLLTRRVLNYGLPDHLRLTIGLEEHNRAVVEALAEFMKA